MDSQPNGFGDSSRLASILRKVLMSNRLVLGLRESFTLGLDKQMAEIYQQAGTQDAASLPPERRQHRRLEMHLPLEFRRVSEPSSGQYRSVTRDVSTGGIYFETGIDDLQTGELLDIEMTIPPGEGHFPYQGRVSSVAKVVRTKMPATGEAPKARIGIGAAFRESFNLSF